MRLRPAPGRPRGSRLHDVLLRDAGVARLRVEAQAVRQHRRPPAPSRPRAPRTRARRGARAPAPRGTASGCRAASSRAAPTGAGASPRRAPPRSARARARPARARASAWSATTSSADSTGSTDSSGWRSDLAEEHLELLLGRRVAEADAHAEAVELRLGQRVGAVELDRVLRREHEERLRQRPRHAVDRDLALAHRLEQRRLRARRGAVDLVGEQHVARRSGPRWKVKLPSFGL